jgi:GNAT superfamily N-acetyltransferase
MLKLTGFTVRRPTASEVESIVKPFGSASLTAGSPVVYGAFGQPGEVPLGGLLIRPFGHDAAAMFLIMVWPEFRRKGIGSRLMQELRTTASHNGINYLRLATMVHQDDPMNLFCEKVGLTAERTFGSYTVDLALARKRVTERPAARFLRSAGATGVKIMPMENAELPPIARFFSDHYGGVFDHRLEDMRQGKFDRAISPVALAGDRVLACILCRSQPQNPAVFIDLILVHPQLRSTALSMVVFDHMARWALTRGYRDVVYEADAEHDPSAIGLARRLDVKPRSFRRRYSMGKAPTDKAPTDKAPTE